MAPQPQDVRRRAGRVEDHEVAPAVPQEARFGQQIVHLVGAVCGRTEDFGVELEPAGLAVLRVQVHHADDDIRAVGAALGIGDQLLVVDRQEMQAGGLLGRQSLFSGDYTGSDFRPNEYTDYVLVPFAQEFGFVGVAVLFLLYGLLLVRSVLAAWHARDPFGGFLAAGVVVLLTIHIVINVGMTIGILPVIGIPLCGRLSSNCPRYTSLRDLSNRKKSGVQAAWYAFATSCVSSYR